MTGDKGGPTRMVGVSTDGLSILLDGDRYLVGWEEVLSITGGVSRRDDNLVFIGFELDGKYGERTLLVAECDSIWSELLKLLHLCLPVAPLEAWVLGISSVPGVYLLYQRPYR